MTAATQRRRVKPILEHVTEDTLHSRYYRRSLRATFDAAALSDPDTKNLWTGADHLSPNRAASPSIRKTLRQRARHEFKNNSYCRGMVQTFGNDVIGRGPRLQMLSEDESLNADIERSHRRWRREARFAAKLRQLVCDRCITGEPIAKIVTNSRLSPVTLDIQILECDRLQSPGFRRPWPTGEDLDGIELNEIGEPILFHLLNDHPGGAFGGSLEGRWFPRTRVVWWPYTDRPEQIRGVPMITAALPLYGILRRFTLAVLGAAENVADISALMKTNANPQDAQVVDALLEIPMVKRMLLTLPAGWDVTQIRPEQPSPIYKEFKREILAEIARVVFQPYNVAAADSSEHNYSSGRLDHGGYQRAISVFRDDLDVVTLEPLTNQWLREYMAVTHGVRPSQLDLDKLPYRWRWDPFPHVDPLKERLSAVKLWEKALLTDEEFLMVSETDFDPEEHYASATRMMRRREKLGLPRPGIAEQAIRVEETTGAR